MRYISKDCNKFGYFNGLNYFEFLGLLLYCILGSIMIAYI